MTQSVPVGEVRPLGDRALLIGVADPAAARTLAAALAPALAAGDVEVVCGLATVGVLVRDADAALDPLRAVVREVLDATAGPGPARRRGAAGPPRQRPLPVRRPGSRRGGRRRRVFER